MAKPRIFVTRVIPEKGLQMVQGLAADYDIEVWRDPLPPAYDVLLQKVQGVTGLYCLLTDKIDANLMDTIGPQVKVISRWPWADNVDVPAATARGIPVGNTPGVLTDTTADFAWTLLMAAARRVVEGDKFTRTGKWKTWGPIDFLGPDVTGATLGIVGFGRIGQGMAKRAQGFDMRILYFDTQRYPEAEEKYGAQYVDMGVLLHESDFVTLHTVLSEETYHLMDDERLRMMKLRHFDQHFARPGSRSGSVISRARQQHNRLCCARCDRARADRSRRSLVDAGQHHHRAAHCQRQFPDPQQNGDDGRREFDRGLEGRTAAQLRKSASV
jgi:glyoxylate reductase